MAGYEYEQYVTNVVIAGAAVLTLGVGTSALVYAKRQIDALKQEAAKTLFREHLDLAVSHPEVASYSSYLWARKADATPVASALLDEKYRWFVAHLLFSTEEILAIVGGDKEWVGALIDNLVSHAPYFTRRYWQTVSATYYSTALVDAVQASIASFEQRFKRAAKDVEDGPVEENYRHQTGGAAHASV